MIIPDWKNLLEDAGAPTIWLPWLSNTGSMTRLLEDTSNAPCQVSVLHEGWQEPWQDECGALALTSARCWIREVVLITHGPVIFARSVFPKKLIEHFPKLMMLGDQPLGKTIFSDNTFKRADIEVAEINKGNMLWQQIPEALQKEKQWARRSIFNSQFGSFLLSEVFLPSLIQIKSSSVKMESK